MLPKNSGRGTQPSWPSENLGKYEKTHSPRCSKNIFQDVFHIKVSFLHLISNGLNGVKVACMVNLKLAFTEWFFFLIIW